MFRRIGRRKEHDIRSSSEEDSKRKSTAAIMKQKNDDIDRDLDRQQEERKVVKILLLGAGESGKSAILKQMRRLYGSPMTEDEQHVMTKSSSMVVEKFHIDGIEYEMYDVGGQQRSGRRKWIDCFDDVDGVIFVAALSAYDQQTLSDAKQTNRMSAALELFRFVCHHRAFAKNTTKILFLNKKDVFLEKILTSDIAAQTPFSDYAGPPQDYNSGVLYFIQKFEECRIIDDDFNDSRLQIQVICATDDSVEFVLDATRTIIMVDAVRRTL
jgi:GTPase SAR1 family protein